MKIPKELIPIRHLTDGGLRQVCRDAEQEEAMLRELCRAMLEMEAAQAAADLAAADLRLLELRQQVLDFHLSYLIVYISESTKDTCASWNCASRGEA